MIPVMVTLAEIESMALKLPASERARLATTLLRSLPQVSAEDHEGLTEARRRSKEMDRDASVCLTHEKFLKATGRLLIIAGIFSNLVSTVAAEEVVPPIQVRERLTPWGTVVERMSYYLKDGEEVAHGQQESFSPTGSIWERSHHAHGELDGLHESFYGGIGIKETETTYLMGLEHGVSRTWAPDGELLFEGTWRNGEEWEGWFQRGGTLSSGLFHRRGQNWKIVQGKGGKEVAGSERMIERQWRDWAPGTLPDQKMFIRWNWSGFGTRSDYPFEDRMPEYQDVPFLIGWIEEKGQDQTAADQLEALTRMQFGSLWMQTDPERITAIARWREWWEAVGKHRPVQRFERGVRDAKAWDLAKRGRNLPMPEDPLVIPEEYVLEVRFGTGEYTAVTSETLTLRRNEGEAELIRKFSTHLDGPVTEEIWRDMEVDEADRVVRALGYLIDRPWLLNNEDEIEKRYWAAEKKDPERESLGSRGDEQLKGRESYGPLYYPRVDFELCDTDGKLWWNADPDTWHGANPQRFNHAHQPVPGTVFPFLAALFPESARWRNDGRPGWEVRQDTVRDGR